MVYPLRKTVWHFLKKLNIHLTIRHNGFFLRCLFKKTENMSTKDLYANVHSSFIFIIGKHCKQLSKTLYLNERRETQMSTCVIILNSRKVILAKSIYNDKRQISSCLSPRIGKGDCRQHEETCEDDGNIVLSCLGWWLHGCIYIYQTHSPAYLSGCIIICKSYLNKIDLEKGKLQNTMCSMMNPCV